MSLAEPAIWHDAQFEHISANPEAMDVPNAVQELARCYWHALAAAAFNPDVFLFIPDGVTWVEDSAWEQYEMLTLTWNPCVQRIWRVDPRGAPGSQKLIWIKDPVVAHTQNIETGKRPFKKVCVK